MTCYNSAPYLKAAFKSIIKQTYTNWEIIIVEDCSTDESLLRIDEYINKYKLQDKVKLFKHKHNKGYGTSLRKAIEHGSGELVAVIDSDDALSGKYSFSTMVDAHHKHPNASLVYSTYYFCRNNLAFNQVKKILRIPEGRTYLDTMLNPIKIDGKNRYPRVSHLKVFKRSAYDKTVGLKKGLLKAVDRDLVLKLEEVGDLVYIDKPLYVHRKHDGNITNLFGSLSPEKRQEIIDAKAQIIEDAKKRRGIK